MRKRFTRVCFGSLGWVWAATAAAQTPASCDTTRPTAITQVVELYTSEGCSSCPPADRWLSTLSGRDEVLAMSFHVSYWDRLGWPDPYASAESTQRQYRWADRFRSAQVYTPQVVANGHDWRGWRHRDLPRDLSSAPLRVHLTRDAQGVHARVQVSDDGVGARTFGAYWVYLQDGIQTRVKAGENAGETLRHDHVVRWQRQEDLWTGRDGAQWTAPAPGPGTDRVALIVTADDGLTPLAAAQMTLCK